MVVLGLLLLAASVATAVSIAVSNTDSSSFDVFGQTITSMSAGGLMLLGLALGVAALLGLWLMGAGRTRNKHRREADRNDAAQSRSRVDELEAENIRLRKLAERHEAGGAAASTDYVADSSKQVNGADERPPQLGVRAGTTGIDLRHAATDGDARAVYPNDSGYAEPPVTTPAFDDTARHQGNRVFGRRNKAL